MNGLLRRAPFLRRGMPRRWAFPSIFAIGRGILRRIDPLIDGVSKLSFVQTGSDSKNKGQAYSTIVRAPSSRPAFLTSAASGAGCREDL